MKVCALIPAYNEEKHIADVIRRTRAIVPDVVVYDDGSTDATGRIARECGAEVLVHSPNQGKGATLADGLDELCTRGYDAVIALDADGQHLPEEIPAFLVAGEEADIVLGTRMAEQKEMPWLRWQTNRVTSGVISWLAGVKVSDSQVGFRLIRCSAWKAIDVKTRNFDFEGEMLVAAGRAGLRIREVPISTVYGDEVSKINPVIDTIRFIQMALRLWWTR